MLYEDTSAPDSQSVSEGKPGPPILTIIVPTRNEANNVEPLLTRISAALAETSLEVIFVDDSSDNTAEVIEQQKSNFPFDIQVIQRPPERHNGLGNAVVEGMGIANSEWVCVIDGDLQHPPEVIPQLLAAARSQRVDLVAGSRLAEGGGVAGLSWSRVLISRTLALGSRALFPRQLANVSDPLTGFFIFRRTTVNPDALMPKGFKILLEILIRCPKLKVAEVPFEFAERHAGESKANVQQVLALFEQLLDLRLKAYAHLMRFATVGASGILVNSLFIFLFTELAGINYLVSAVLATQCSSLWNFAWTEKWVFQDRRAERKGYWKRLTAFLAVSDGALLIRTPLLAFLVAGLGVNYLIANFVTLVLMTVARYAISDRVIWIEFWKGQNGILLQHSRRHPYSLGTTTTRARLLPNG